jgi:hypothetical protein
VTGTDSRAHRDRWEDEAALRDLSVAYAAAADARDGERFAGLFAVDGALVVPSYPEDLRPVITRAGTESLRLVPEGLGRFELTFHEVTNSSFTIGDERASGQVQCTAHHLSATGAAGASGGGPAWTDTVWFIRYHDEYVRVATGWKFARRVLHLQWVEEHAVERVGPPSAGPGDAGPDPEAPQAPGTGTGGGGPT